MEIVFSTFNARYSHTALSLRCLRANLGPLHDRSVIVEFDNRIAPHCAAEKLLAHNPVMIHFSVYIWNLTLTTETVRLIKEAHPEIRIVIGGPEVSYEYEDLDLFQLTDHLVCGEGESVIGPLCRSLLPEQNPGPQASSLPRFPKVIHSPPADLKRIALPYSEYTDEDIAHRRIYVESSRGCPFHCEYCLSSVGEKLRFFPPSRIFPEFQKLMDRGVRIFKFLDRSFNINTVHAAAVMRFFLENRKPGMMLHLEWEPERLPSALETLLADAPPGFYQLEAGVQTFNPEVSARIRRPLNADNVEKHLRRLAALPSVHLHADLIAGLPGETFDSIAAGFDRLHACGPDEIQLGILKKLRGAPIARHDAEWEMIYNTAPPYDVLQTTTLSAADLIKIRRFARFWDITVNNGRFPLTAPMLWAGQPSVFAAFLEWSEWIYGQTGTTFGFSPARLAGLLEEFITQRPTADRPAVRAALEADLGTAVPSAKGLERQGRGKRGKS